MSLRRISTLHSTHVPPTPAIPLSSSHGERSFVEEGKNSSFLLQSLSPPLSIAIRTCIPPPPQGRLLEGGKRGENAVVMQVSLWSSNFSHQKTRQGGYTHTVEVQPASTNSPPPQWERKRKTKGKERPKRKSSLEGKTSHFNGKYRGTPAKT